MKIYSAKTAVSMIQDGDTIAVGGGVGIGVAELVLRTLGELENGPKNLTLVHSAGIGDGESKGLNHFAKPGLLKRVIGGHWGLAPKLQELAINNKIEAYNIPQGVMTHLFRDIAAHRPGHLTKIGMDTFTDPRNGGGRLNSRTTKNIAQHVTVNDTFCLFYPSFPINVAIIRATSSDQFGNLTMEREALTLDTLSIAMAAHNSPGIVIAQVNRVVGKTNPRDVKVPGILVDYVVVCHDLEYHPQTYATAYDPVLSHEDDDNIFQFHHQPRHKRAIALRAIEELKKGDVVNLGIGIPGVIAEIAAERNMLNDITLTTESGAVGGLTLGGMNFGASINPHAIIDQPYQFDFYDGGGIDVAFLGFAEVDSQGNVNVSSFKDRIAGAGGFINITQRAKTLVFVGSFMTSKKEIKFVNELSQETFNASINPDREILYITERCVFRLVNGELHLIELLGGYILQRDVLQHMEFTPQVKL